MILFLEKDVILKIDSYSAFFENDDYAHRARRVFDKERNKGDLFMWLSLRLLCFLFGVRWNKLGFDVFIFQDLTKAIDLNNSYEIAKNND